MTSQFDHQSDEKASVALTCGAVYLLQAPGVCYSCQKMTRMFALMALPPFSREGDQSEPMDEHGCMLKEISSLPTDLERSVRELCSGLLRPDFSRTVGVKYWMNHCERCDAKQGDFFVQGADGPFWPYDEAQADAIQATRLEGPFRLPNAETVYSGAMAAWRNQRHGVQRPTPEPGVARKRRAPGPKP